MYAKTILRILILLCLVILPAQVFSTSLLNDLNSLEGRVKDDLKLLNFPGRNWTLNDNQDTYDVIIIGGGMGGMSAAFALEKLGITKIKIFDRNSEGFEGPWKTYARMLALRSSKKIPGPALGLPSLTFQAWFRVLHGDAAWDEMLKIPTDLWADYLHWYRKTLNLPVENDAKLLKLTPAGEHFHVVMSINGKQKTFVTRKVVLATGRGGCGGFAYPEFLKALPKNYYGHTSENIDFNALKDKSIVIIGAGASAFDAAAVALETGVGTVEMIVRRPNIPLVNKFAYFFQPGPQLGHYSLDDETKIHFLTESFYAGVPPPRAAVTRVMGYTNFNVRLNTGIEKAKIENGKVALKAGSEIIYADYVISATGFQIDISKQHELVQFSDKITLWSDKVAGINSLLGKFPYLGAHFQFLERNPGEAPYLRNLHCFNFGAFLSHGVLSGEIAGISVGAQRLAEGIVKDLFIEETEIQLAEFRKFGEEAGSRGEILSNETLERAAQEINEFYFD